MNEHSSLDKETSEQKPPAKKVYVTPVFRFEKVLEVSALSCGKVSVTDAGCRMVRKTS